MGWSIGFDEKWERSIGYGVPAWCDHPECREKIDRGLAYVCGGEPYGGEHGCGLFFCGEHMHGTDDCMQVCERCRDHAEPFDKKPEHPEWMRHVLAHDSWHQWRVRHPKTVKAYRDALAGAA